MVTSTDNVLENVLEKAKKVVAAYREKIKIPSAESKQSTPNDAELNEIIAFFKRDANLRKHIDDLKHIHIVALAYFDEELAKQILEYEIAALPQQYAHVLVNLNEDLKTQIGDEGVASFRRDFKAALQGLDQLRERHKNNAEIDKQIWGVQSSLPTCALFEEYYLDINKAAQVISEENLEKETEKSKELRQLADVNLARLLETRFEDITTEILKASDVVKEDVRLSVANNKELSKTLIEKTKFLQTPESIKLVAQLASTADLCKIMKPTMGNMFAHLFWTGSYAGQLLKSSDVVARLIKGDEVDIEVLKAFLANRWIGKKYWKDTGEADWNSLLQYLGKKLSANDSNLTLALEKYKEVFKKDYFIAEQEHNEDPVQVELEASGACPPSPYKEKREEFKAAKSSSKLETGKRTELEVLPAVSFTSGKTGVGDGNPLSPLPKSEKFGTKRMLDDDIIISESIGDDDAEIRGFLKALEAVVSEPLIKKHATAGSLVSSSVVVVPSGGSSVIQVPEHESSVVHIPLNSDKKSPDGSVIKPFLNLGEVSSEKKSDDSSITERSVVQTRGLSAGGRQRRFEEMMKESSVVQPKDSLIEASANAAEIIDSSVINAVGGSDEVQPSPVPADGSVVAVSAQEEVANSSVVAPGSSPRPR